VTTAIFESITSKSRNNLFDVLMTNIYVNQRKRSCFLEKEYLSVWDFTSYGIFFREKERKNVHSGLIVGIDVVFCRSLTSFFGDDTTD